MLRRNKRRAAGPPLKTGYMTDFDPDFATPSDWARMYRALRIQAVPAKHFTSGDNWKRPALPTWREHTEQFVSNDLFEKWYGSHGEYANFPNVGMITGMGVDRYWVLDLDLQKHNGAQEWINALLVTHNNGMDLDTPTQRTGGGGLQIIFRAPPGWTPPTCKTPIGVDIRGVGGFAMLPPSMHSSGVPYAFLEGYEPWNMPVMTAPAWLCDAIDRLVKEHGGGSGTGASTGPREVVPATHTLNAFGMIIDGREELMTKMVWAKVVAMARSAPFHNIGETLKTDIQEGYREYESKVSSRIREPGTPKHLLLEREGRGWVLYQEKFQYALSQWETKVREAAAVKLPQDEPGRSPSLPGGQDVPFDPATGEILDALDGDAYEVLFIPDINAMPDPVWLIEGAIIEKSLGFIYGPPGCGKSFITLGLSRALAAGQADWWGRAIHKTGPVVYISSEGIGDMKHRLAAWHQGSGAGCDQDPFALIHQSINFMDEGDVDRLLRTVHRVASQVGDPVLVVVDTVSRVLPGAEENLQKDMTIFVKACDRVREAFGTTVLGVHHTARAGNMRGSTVLEGAGDFIFGIEREEGHEVGVMTARKIKAAEDGWKQNFRLKKLLTGDLKGTESLYAEPTTAEEAEPESLWPDRQTCKDILQAIAAAWAEGKPWSPNHQARATGRYAVENITRMWGLKKDRVETMLSTWQANNVLSYEQADSHTKAFGLRVLQFI